jgi:putative ABC transport system permease protein
LIEQIHRQTISRALKIEKKFHISRTTATPPGFEKNPQQFFKTIKIVLHLNYKYSSTMRRLYTAINIFGLAIGIAACLLILLYIEDELGFDRFHRRVDHIYQLTCDRLSSKETDKHFAIAAMVQGPAFKKEIPEIDDFARVNPQPIVIRRNADIFDATADWVDSSFFSIFSFPLLAGDPLTALRQPHSVVLTEETAIKYFGTTDALGKSLDILVDGNFEPFTVSAIARRPPENSSIRFSILLPFAYLERLHPDNGWMWVSYPTFFVLHPGSDPHALGAKMNDVFLKRAKKELDDNRLMGYTDRFVWDIQPFKTMHLNTRYEGIPEAGDPVYSYILSGIAIGILTIACLNFVNLSVAQFFRRRREVGIRKTIGALRSQLIVKFLRESLLLCALAFGLALVLTTLLLPLFNQLANKKLGLASLLGGWALPGYLALFLITGLAAGLYPAIRLSGLDTLDSLYDRNRVGGKLRFAHAGVVIQFALANLLLIITLFMYSQFRFLAKKDLGYNDRDLLVVQVDKTVMNPSLARTIRAALTQQPGVVSAGCHNIGRFGGPTRANGREFPAVYDHIDESYLPTLQLPLVAGRNLSQAFPTDSTASVLVNETFVRAAGWSDPIGKTIDYMNFPNWGDRKVTVAGVVKDYHFQSLRERIQPQVLTFESQLPYGQFLVRLRPTQVAQTLQSLERAVQSFAPFQPFRYNFKSDLNLRSYDPEMRWEHIIGLGAAMAILVSVIGLFGLASLSIQQRKNEIAIRKILGAGTCSISRLLSGEFITLVLIAFVIAAPAGAFISSRWLQNFAYKIPLYASIFALAGAISIAIAMLTISLHTLKAALANPVRSLQTLTLVPLFCLFVHSAPAQSKDSSTLPAKTGDEWRMPDQAVRKARNFSTTLQQNLRLNDEQTRKIFGIYLANTKPVDEIRLNPTLNEKAKTQALKANSNALNEKIRGVLTPDQFDRFLRQDRAKMGY